MCHYKLNIIIKIGIVGESIYFKGNLQGKLHKGMHPRKAKFVFVSFSRLSRNFSSSLTRRTGSYLTAAGSTIGSFIPMVAHTLRPLRAGRAHSVAVRRTGSTAAYRVTSGLERVHSACLNGNDVKILLTLHSIRNRWKNTPIDAMLFRNHKSSL